MTWTPAAVDRIVDDFAARLRRGWIVMYASRPDGQTPPLVRQPLAGFAPAVDGLAVALDLSPSQIDRDGTARWAELLATDGEVLAVVRVRSVEEQAQADPGDVLVDRTDFHQGGLLTLARVTLTGQA